MLQGFHIYLDFLKTLNIYQSNFHLPCYEGCFFSKFPAINIIVNPSLSTKEEVTMILSEWIDHKLIYTDGSKNDNAVSFAIFDPSLNAGVGHKINRNSSIFTAEAVAVLSALKHIKNCNLGHKKWLVVSDSMSVLYSLANNNLHANTNYIIFHIKQLWFELHNSNIRITFMWVPAHKGVTGNEKADYLANSITKFADVIPDNTDGVNFQVPFTDIVSLLKARMCESWSKHSYHCTYVENKGSWYAALDVRINNKPWFCKINRFFGRKFYSTICRIRLGHCRLNYHLHRLNIVDSPYCQYCQTNIVQSLDHIFFECSSFSIQRLVLIDELLANYNDSALVPRDIKKLLTNPSIFFYLYMFIVNTVNEL